MGLEEFANAVLAAVREKADGAFSAWITTNRKNNGIKLTAICANSPDSSGGPCVYLDDYYREYMCGNMEIGAAAENVYLRIMEHRNDLRDVNVASYLCKAGKCKYEQGDTWDDTAQALFGFGGGLLHKG
mgnify:CR=1 FL=1